MMFEQVFFLRSHYNRYALFGAFTVAGKENDKSRILLYCLSHSLEISNFMCFMHYYFHKCFSLFAALSLFFFAVPCSNRQSHW